MIAIQVKGFNIKLIFTIFNQFKLLNNKLKDVIILASFRTQADFFNNLRWYLTLQEGNSVKSDKRFNYVALLRK